MALLTSKKTIKKQLCNNQKHKQEQTTTSVMTKKHKHEQTRTVVKFNKEALSTINKESPANKPPVQIMDAKNIFEMFSPSCIHV